MKFFSNIKRILLSVCAVICGVCSVGAVVLHSDFAKQENRVEAKAETTTTATIDWRGTYTGSTTLDWFYIGFAGFTTKDDYKGNANSDYVFQNILLNGKSLYEINATTDVSGWEWDVFPQTPGNDFADTPIIGYIKDTNGIRRSFAQTFAYACLRS